ncbi:trypsin-like serine peptidase [Roseomonas sp. F4]
MLLLLLASPAAAQLPGLGEDAARQPVPTGRAPWSSLVRVQSEAGGRCTGVLITPNLVLTAAHCVVARRTQQPLRPERLHVLAGYDRGDFTAHAQGAALRIAPGYDPASGGPTAADWAVLRLARRLPNPFLPLAPLPQPGAAVALGGWQQDRAHALLADTNCRVLAVQRDTAGRILLRHDCAGTRGVSGAPLLVQQGSGWAVAGVAVTAIRDGRGGFAVAVQGLPLAE